MSEEFLAEQASPLEDEEGLFVNIPLSYGVFLKKLMELGFTKKAIVNYAIRKLTEMDVKTLVWDMVSPKAEAVSLVEKVVEEKPVEEGVEAE